MHLFEKRNFTFTTSLTTLRHDDLLNWVQPIPIFSFGIICGPGWGSFTVEDHLRSILGSFAVLREANSHTPAPRVGENPGNDVDEDVLRGSSRVPASLVGLVGKHTEICKADRTMWKLTLQDINTTPKEPKAERGRSRRQLFLPFRGSSVERPCCKIPAQERLRGRLAPCMAMIVQKLRPQTPDFPAENTWGVEFLGGTHFRDTLGSKFPDQFSLRQRTSDLFEKRSGYERSHDHFKPAGRVCLFWVSSFEKYMTVFSGILVDFGLLMLWILAQTPRRNYNPGNFTLGNFCFNSGQLCSGPCEAWFLTKTNSRWRREARRTTADYNGIEGTWKH